MKDIGYLAIIALIAGAFGYCYPKALRDTGAKEQIIVELTLERDSLKSNEDSIKKAYKRNTVTLTKKEIERVPIIQKVTEYIDRNIPVPVEVVKEVIKADSQVIQACHVAINTCEQLQSNLRAQLRTADSTIVIQDKLLHPSLVTKAKTAGFWMGIGILLYSTVK